MSHLAISSTRTHIEPHTQARSSDQFSGSETTPVATEDALARRSLGAKGVLTLRAGQPLHVSFAAVPSLAASPRMLPLIVEREVRVSSTAGCGVDRVCEHKYVGCPNRGGFG
jgi:hypothetical protein